MTSIFTRNYYNSWFEGIGGFFTTFGALAVLPQNPLTQTILLYSILEKLHTGQAVSIELQILQRLTSCDRLDIEALQILTMSQALPLKIELTKNIVKAEPR
jgi:hypothetical protein